MQTYPLDIDAVQVVRWIMAESEAAPSHFKVLARRAFEVQDLPARRELRLGDEEREDLTEVETVATLEIAPEHAAKAGFSLSRSRMKLGHACPKRAGWVKETDRSIFAGFTTSSSRPDAASRMSLRRWRMMRPKCASIHSSAASKQTATAQAGRRLNRGAGQVRLDRASKFRRA